MTNRVYNSIIGFIVGDALGSPVEFIDKSKLPPYISDFIAYGQHNMPKGAWTDDSSLMLCLLETINENGLDFQLLSEKMVKWLFYNYMTPTGKTFGVGRATLYSIGKIKRGASYLESGETRIQCNGNGSLMRILPLAFYLEDNDDKYKFIETCSKITHAHPISYISCSIFIEYFHQLIKHNDKLIAYKNMQDKISRIYKTEDLTPFDRILKQNIYEQPIESLSGLGYVVSTLEVVLYSFINSNNYMDCVNLAISFGNDTDTNSAITGSLAGYFYEDVPEKLQKDLLKYDEINEMINQFIKNTTR